MMGLVNRMRLFLTTCKGNVAVEFAFILPVLIIFVFLLIEFANYLWVRNVVDHAAHETVRWAIVRGPWGAQWPGNESTLEANMETYAVSRVSGGSLRQAAANATASVDIANRTLNLTLSYNYTPMVVPITVISAGVVTSSVTMDIQRP